VAEGGRVLTRIGTGMRRAIACNFGGGDLGTLYVTTAGRAHEVDSGTTGRIEAIDVDVPGAGQA
jgi:sugar lactone lactonase YvrE